MLFPLGFYCKLNSSSNTPNDNITGGPCPKGKFCPRGSYEGDNCPEGMLNCIKPIELKRTGTLPEAQNLKPKFWSSGGITRPPCENRARSFAKYKQNPGRKLQEMS